MNEIGSQYEDLGMSGTEASDKRTITLPAALDLPAAGELLDALKNAVQTGAGVRIDASGVETVTFPCIQIIVAATKPGSSVSIENPSTAFIDAFMDLGLGLDLPVRQSENGAIAGDEMPAVEALQEKEPEPAASPLQSDAASLAAEPAEQETCETPAGKRILTIDDSKTMRDMLMLTLSSSGYDVVQAVDGEDGLDVLKRENVDVVITDINMPKMDGYGVIQNLRQDPNYDATPILVLTTESDREKKERARELGATGFIVKPFNPTSLVEVIRKVSP
jgi:two-component system chemotaxis response regulator CheY